MTAPPREKRQAKPRNHSRTKTFLNLAAAAVTLLIIAATLVWLFAFHFYTVTSNSMSPTLLGGPGERDRLLCGLWSYRRRGPERWEITVFHTPTRENLEAAAKGGKLSIKHDMTVKRIVGTGGERLAIRDGDIWSRRGGEVNFTRRAKPDPVQREVWIPVYGESFLRAGAKEFQRFWRTAGEGALAFSSGVLRIVPPVGGVGFAFVPTVRTGPGGLESRETAGIPDRYLLPQRLLFACPNPACGLEFEAWHTGAQVQAHCPRCGSPAFEEDVLFHTYDSGFPVGIPEGVSGMPLGESNRMRVFPYHMVGDLRIALELRLSRPDSRCILGLSRNGAEDRLEVGAGRLALNGRNLPGGNGSGRDKWISVELWRVDGTLRVFVDGARIASLPVPDDGFPSPDAATVASGAFFAVEGGGVDIRSIAVDRDIHYFGGGGNFMMPQFNAMDANDEIDIPAGHFLPLGDNADVSLDARSWGPVPENLLVGAALAISGPRERRRVFPTPGR